MFVNESWGSSPLPEFQSFKLIFAAYLADIGFPEKCLEFLDSIMYLSNHENHCINHYCLEKLQELYDRLSPETHQNLEKSKANDSGIHYGENYSSQNYNDENYDNQYYVDEKHDNHYSNDENYYNQNYGGEYYSDNLQLPTNDQLEHQNQNSLYNDSAAYQTENNDEISDFPAQSKENSYTLNENQNLSASMQPELISKSFVGATSNLVEEHSKNEQIMPPPPIPVPSESRKLSNYGNDDLGFGNSSLKKKESKSVELEIKEKEAAKGSTPNLDKSKDGINLLISHVIAKKNGGLWSSITSILPFGVGIKDKDEGAKEMHLPQGSSFVYDPNLKKWVNKKGGIIEKEESLAPPPLIPEKLASSLPNNDNQLLKSGTINEKGSQKKRSARSKYVDVMNPTGTTTEMPTLVPQFTPSNKPNHEMMAVKIIITYFNFIFLGCGDEHELWFICKQRV